MHEIALKPLIHAHDMVCSVVNEGNIDLIRENLKAAERDSKAELKSRETSNAKRP